MVVKTCPVDANGYFNFGAANLWHGAVASRAKIVIVETGPALPYVHGIENGLHMSQVDYVIEGDGQPVPELPSAAPTDADRAVAQLIAAEIDDGACLQVGIGAMPNAVCSLLMESGVRNLGIHTEMLTDGIIDLRTRQRAPQPHRAEPDTRQRRHRSPQRHDVRGHGVRAGQPQGEVHSRTR